MTREQARLAAIDRELARHGLRIKTHGWRLSLGGPDDAPRAYMLCPCCDADVLISTERTR
jgi:hypothetical protein